MNLAILHYHLNRGGVTRVIENQLEALDAVLEPGQRHRVAVIYGGRHKGFNEQLPKRLKTLQVGLHPLPSLDYDQQSDDRGGSESLSDDLAALLEQLGFAPHDTLLHVHNHALGKNVALPTALRRLAGDGFALLLQTHDFPEDFRPDNYRRLLQSGLAQAAGPSAVLYPQAPHVHYAVLNGRDEAILSSAGVPTERLHRLPNPVPKMDDLPSKAHARRRLAERFGVAEHERFVLYPVRCIRRKNVGEALLYAALAPPATVVGLTLPPLNPQEVPGYESWRRLAAELELPCRFDVGAPGGLSLPENLAAADLILTTSLAEGFGMVFLEAWLAGRPLLGRDLPEITRDFTDVGLRLDRLRPRLAVPVDWLGVDLLRQTILAAYRRTLEAYGRQQPQDLDRRFEAKIEQGTFDFGDLDETLQQAVLRAVRTDDDRRRRLLQGNPWIGEAMSIDDQNASDLIRQNVSIIKEHYGHEPSGRRLLRLYRQVSVSRRGDVSETLFNGERILDAFLDFARFRPIRS